MLLFKYETEEVCAKYKTIEKGLNDIILGIYMAFCQTDVSLFKIMKVYNK